MDELYEPAEDSFLLQKHIKKYACGRVLDMCTGSGILAREAAKYADEVVASDINPAAVAKKQEKNITFVLSDLFENIAGTFDLIICNPPYLPTDEKHPDLALDGGRKGYEFTKRFFCEAKPFLKTNGRILFLFSTLTNKKKVDAILKKGGWQFEQVDSMQLPFFEELFVYLVTFKS